MSDGFLGDMDATDSLAVELPESWQEHAKAWKLQVFPISCDTDQFQDVISLRSKAYSIDPELASDPIDQYSTIWLARSEGLAVGTIRVTYSRHGRLDCEEFFPPLLLRNYSEYCGSASRFCVHPDSVGKIRVARLLMELAWRKAISDGIRMDVIDVNYRAIRYYERLGYFKVGGTDFIHPLLGTKSCVMICLAGPDCRGTISNVIGNCSSPIRIREILNNCSIEVDCNLPNNIEVPLEKNI